MGAGGPQGSGRTNAGGHKRPHRSAPRVVHGGGPYGGGSTPSPRRRRQTTRAVARTPLARYQHPKGRVTSHTKEHVAATPKRVKRQVTEAQHPGSAARKAYERHYRGLWKKFGGQYPLLHGKMPKLEFSKSKNFGAFTPWGDTKHVVVSQTMANAFVSKDKAKKHWAAQTPLHEWQHNQQGAKYGKKGEMKVPSWRLEGRAQNKMYRNDPDPKASNPDTTGGGLYHKYALAENFPKIAKRLDKGDMGALYGYKRPNKKKVQKATTRYFKERVSRPRAGASGNGVGYALIRANAKAKRKG